MMPVSYRLGWATRGVDGPGVAVSVASAAAFALGALGLQATRDPSPLIAYWCSGIFTAALVAANFPGAGHARWSEFELALPIDPREQARTRLLLSLGFWLLPVVVALALAQIGAFGASQRVPASALFGALSSALTSVLLVVALRHGVGLGLAGFAAAALRLLMIGIIVLGFSQPSTLVTTGMLVAAMPLLAIAHRAAARTPQLPLPRATTRPARAVQGTTFDRVALRYVLGSPYGAGLLVLLLLWVFAFMAGWLLNVVSNVLFILMWVAYHAAYSARLLRLDYLPVARERLFRFVVWPSLAAVAIGVALAMLLPARLELGSVERDGGGFRLRTPERGWQLTTTEPPLIMAPSGESHRPAAHAVGFGLPLTAYDPYEASPQASRAFLVHQLGRLVAEQRGLVLGPDELEQRFLSGIEQRRSLDDQRFPELGEPRMPLARLAGGAVLIALALAVLHIVIAPGRALDARTWRRRPLPWVLAGLLLIAELPLLAPLVSTKVIGPQGVVLGALGRALVEHSTLALLVALALAVHLYRSLPGRFAKMEAPRWAKSMDAWFSEI